MGKTKKVKKMKERQTDRQTKTIGRQMEKYTEGQQITDRATHQKTVKRQIRHGLKSYIYNRTNPHERRPFKVGQRDDFPRFLYDGESDAESTLPYAHTWKKISVFSRCGTSNGRGFTLCHVQIYVNHDSREILGLISGHNQRRACGREQLRTRPDTRPIPVTDGWAGAKMRVFTLSNSITTDRPTNRPTNGRTDGRTKPLIESLVRD